MRRNGITTSCHRNIPKFRQIREFSHSLQSKDFETIRENPRWRSAGSISERSENSVQYLIKSLSDILRENPKHEIAILL
jgi:hypothetical protein